MRKMNRRGMSKKVIALIIALVAVALVFGLWIYMAEFASDSTYDSICHYTSVAQDKAEAVNLYFPVVACKMRDEDIYPDDWDECNERFEESGNTKACLADQIAEYMRTCWVTRGAGKLDVGDMDCFRLTIFPPKDDSLESPSISLKYLKDFMKEYTPPRKNGTYSSYLDTKSIGDIDEKINTNELWVISYREDWDLIPKFISEDGIELRKVPYLDHGETEL